MKLFRNIILWVLAICLFIFLMQVAGEADRKDCEERVAKELNTTAVYMNNQCLVKGYGRYGGR